MNVLPIGSTSIDWTTYLTAMKQLLGRSITTELDLAGMKPANLASFFVTLGSAVDSSLSSNEILADPGFLLRHGSYSFLTVLNIETIIELMEETSLSVVSIPVNRDRLVIISGSLEDWRNAIINCCSAVSGFDLRVLMDICMLHFEKSGLTLLWSCYRKTSINDRTFVLEKK